MLRLAGTARGREGHRGWEGHRNNVVCVCTPASCVCITCVCTIVCVCYVCVCVYVLRVCVYPGIVGADGHEEGRELLRPLRPLHHLRRASGHEPHSSTCVVLQVMSLTPAPASRALGCQASRLPVTATFRTVALLGPARRASRASPRGARKGTVAAPTPAPASCFRS